MKRIGPRVTVKGIKSKTLSESFVSQYDGVGVAVGHDTTIKGEPVTVVVYDKPPLHPVGSGPANEEYRLPDAWVTYDEIFIQEDPLP